MMEDGKILFGDALLDAAAIELRGEYVICNQIFHCANSTPHHPLPTSPHTILPHSISLHLAPSALHQPLHLHSPPFHDMSPTYVLQRQQMVLRFLGDHDFPGPDRLLLWLKQPFRRHPGIPATHVVEAAVQEAAGTPATYQSPPHQ